MRYETRAYCRYGYPPAEFRTEEQLRDFLSSVRMPVSMQEQAVGRWKEERSGRKVATSQPSGPATPVQNHVKTSEQHGDEWRRARLATLQELVRQDAEAGDEPDEQDIQDAMDSLYDGSDNYQYLGCDDNYAYCMDGEDLYRHAYTRNPSGDVVLGEVQQMSLSAEEVSSMRARFPKFELAQLKAAERNYYRQFAGRS